MKTKVALDAKSSTLEYLQSFEDSNPQNLNKKNDPKKHGA